jgi:hypothetical protein
VIVVHDLGKLDERWQAWAHRWQEEMSRLRGEDLVIAGDYMAAHTDYDGQDEAEEALSGRLYHMKPNHAVESAQAAEDLLWQDTDDQVLVRAALSAIAHHHTAGASGSHGRFIAHPAAKGALAEVVPDLDVESAAWSFPEGSLARRLIRPNREAELLPYLLLVRILRLADQRSQQVSRRSK